MCAGLVLWCGAAVMAAVVDAADFCLADDDCDYAGGVSLERRGGRRGRTCVRLYDGCLVGQCMCRSRYPSTLDSHGRCVDSKAQSCSSRLINDNLCNVYSAFSALTLLVGR